MSRPSRVWPGHRARTQRGAALLVAMLIVTLVATLASGMVWQQWRAIEVESADRARAQAGWLIEGTTDWARIILREDARGSGGKAAVDSPDENWGIPLRDVKLSDFLAADRDNTRSTDLDAVLSGAIVDAQSRYNLRNLINDEPDEAEKQLKVLRRLCDVLGLPMETAARIAEGMNGASLAEDQLDEEEAVTPGAPLPPQRLEQLTWLGLDADAVRRLSPYVTILYGATPVNVNTASPEVLSAVIEGLDRGTAERLVRTRPPGGYETLDAVKKQLPDKLSLEGSQVGVSSNHFEITGELRYDQYVLRERTLVQRRGLDVFVLSRERLSHE